MPPQVLALSMHPYGCRVIQRVLEHTGPEEEAQQRSLVGEVAERALALSQDQYGNYVVQSILSLGLDWASAQVMACLEGHFCEVSVQKFGSNVAEKCLKIGDGPLQSVRDGLIRELVATTSLERLLQDPYGNYVVQSALAVSRGQLHSELVEAIRPHMAAIKSSPYGKRILARSALLSEAFR